MLTPKELEIFNVFSGNIFRELTLKEIKQLSKQKSNNAVQIALNKFIKEELIKEKKVGNNRLISVNTKNDLIFNYFEIYSNNKLQNLGNRLIPKIIKNIKEKLDINHSFYSIIIFGSYANDTYSSNSDLDILILVKDKKEVNKIERIINDEKILSSVEIDSYVITLDELIRMLSNNENNLGKEITIKNLPITNSRIFYNTILRTINYEFILRLHK